MAHPHKSLLDEMEIGINKIPPTLPGLKDEATKTLAALRADQEVSEDAILEAIADFGRKEYAHRRAISNLHDQETSEVEVDMVLEHVEPNVRKKLEGMLSSGAKLEELIKSDWFTKELNAAERYQVEDGLLLARYKLEHEDKGFVEKNKDAFEKLVKEWEAKAKEIDGLISGLANLAGTDPQYKEEIEDQVKTFSAGWSIVERDPDPKEITTTIDYWKGVLGLDEE